jgi:hypothetical protein
MPAEHASPAGVPDDRTATTATTDPAGTSEAEVGGVEDETRAAEDESDELATNGPGHVELRTIVLPGRKIVFVPNLKAGCTSLLWMLARLAGLRAQRFETSSHGAVSPAMTIHTMSAWPSRLRWAEVSASDREAICADDAWLRLTTVRDPAPRLWSAWQSKLLLREPGFTRRFGDELWFPNVPESPEQIVREFRSFVQALTSDTPPYDAHWAPQTDVLAAAPPLNFVGRLESLDATLVRLREHVGAAWDKVSGAEENRSLLRYAPGLFDADTADVVNTYYAEDYARLGYPPVKAAPEQRDWHDRSRHQLDGIAALIRCHARIDELHRQARRASSYQRTVKQLRAENATLASLIDSSAQNRDV